GCPQTPRCTNYAEKGQCPPN
nr:RecName: Full=Antimicrobial peptide AJN-10 [Anguilla japonica]